MFRCIRIYIFYLCACSADGIYTLSIELKLSFSRGEIEKSKLYGWLNPPRRSHSKSIRSRWLSCVITDIYSINCSVFRDRSLHFVFKFAKMSKDVPTTGTSDNSKDPAASEKPALSRKRESSWPSVLFYIHLNILGLYGVAVLFTNTYFTTIVFSLFLSLIGIIGVTTGAHRLWAHRSYTANPLLRTILMLCQTMAGQVSAKVKVIHQ